MEIPNYDSKDDAVRNYKQLYPFMPNNNFRMLIAGPSGSGKTNTLMHILMKPLTITSQSPWQPNGMRPKWPHSKHAINYQRHLCWPQGVIGLLQICHCPARRHHLKLKKVNLQCNDIALIYCRMKWFSNRVSTHKDRMSRLNNRKTPVQSTALIYQNELIPSFSFIT